MSHRLSESVIKGVLRMTVLALILGSWHIFARGGDALSVPSPADTFRAIGDLIGDGSLVRGLWITNQAMIIGYAISIAISLPLGIFMGLNENLRKIGEPYLTVLLALPTITLLPIVQAIFGLTFASRVIIIVLFAFTYMTVNTMVGVRVVDPQLKEMARSFKASRTQMLTKVILPGAVPGILSGARLGLGRALIGMIIAELLLVSPGIGSMILEYKAGFQPSFVFGILLVLILEGVILMGLATWFERRLLSWREGS